MIMMEEEITVVMAVTSVEENKAIIKILDFEK
jgi:hypothetical protein